MLKTLTVIVLVTLIAHPVAAQKAAGPSLSEQAMKAAELHVQAARWGKVADRSLQAFGLASAAGLAMTGITDQHPQRTRAIDLAWVGSGAVWLIARLKERSLRKRAETLDSSLDPAEAAMAEHEMQIRTLWGGRAQAVED
ncbi:MAG: hypothetical protein OXF79_14855 [Chloroflexi bacterium]|nr:hypothetical protein [Chloroflexota bacterium]